MTLFRLRIFQFLTLPATAWYWLCARLVGGEFSWGPVEDVEDEDD